MVTEKYDKHSGAIIFKKDRESIKLEELEKTVQSLSKDVAKLKKQFKELSKDE